MRSWRIGLGVAGVLMLLFGVVRVITVAPFGSLLVLAVWLIGAIVIHDGLLAPLTVGTGWLLARVVPPRARRYLQGFLIVGGLITIIAVPLILRRDSQPASKAILQQNYGGNLTVLLGLIAAASLLLYAADVARTRGKAPVGPEVGQQPQPADGHE